jgi:hypothetical protein
MQVHDGPQQIQCRGSRGRIGTPLDQFGLLLDGGRSRLQL